MTTDIRVPDVCERDIDMLLLEEFVVPSVLANRKTGFAILAAGGCFLPLMRKGRKIIDQSDP